MLIFLTVVIMAGVAYAHYREGPLTAFTVLVNVLIAGVVAFNFWELLADAIEPMFDGSFLAGCEDLICLVVPFCIILAILRMVANSLCPYEPEYPDVLHRGGGAVLGLVTGYLVAGFLLCVVQTLPVAENFMGFDGKADPSGNAIRAVMPPDRVWLGMMQRAGSYPLSNDEDPKATSKGYDQRYITFDKYSTFELRYGRYRRFSDKPDSPRPYLGELDKQLHR